MQERLAGPPVDVLIDAPPGVSCPALTAVLDSDAILLVTEPTPFGLYDFQLAWEAMAPLGKPLGAVINRAGLGNDAVYRFCAAQGVPILAEIPYERAIAAAYAQGQVIAQTSPALEDLFRTMAARLEAWRPPEVQREAVHA
jgi:MinD superfamily P-loop ATPase